MHIYDSTFDVAVPTHTRAVALGVLGAAIVLVVAVTASLLVVVGAVVPAGAAVAATHAFAIHRGWRFGRRHTHS